MPCLRLVPFTALAFAAAGLFAQPDPAFTLARASLATLDGVVALPGVKARVRVVRDTWGVPHIYAQSRDDLFFAQGYVVAQDRLWQMEMWRRAAEGRLAEITGPAAVRRDRLARLLKYRGPMDDAEWAVYHPEAKRLLNAFADGVNAFIALHADKLPIEFRLTGTRPEPWTAETLILRQNTFGDASSELQLARSVAAVGAEEANRQRNPDPWEELRLPDDLDVSAVDSNVIAATQSGPAVRVPMLEQYKNLLRTARPPGEGAIRTPGSNNWVVSGAMSTTGKPVVVNDPHREVVLPSLRYLMHLQAPGWNVAGASEPPFVGVHIGHSGRLAWGLTIVGTDQHDVYVEELNPSNQLEVKWNGAWEPLRVIREEIRVKGRASEIVELKFSRHGPIFYEDYKRNRAYALRSALHERGTAPYMASLRLAQAQNCREFLDAAMQWHAPSENLICGDVDGNIAWQASALTPSRRGWSGRLPVPGTGAYEWQGFRKDLPRELNPARGFIVTANHNVQPQAYSPPFMFKNADTRFERITRLVQLITPGRKYSLEDHQRIQHDAYSLRAANDLVMFRGWTSANQSVERARAMLAAWDAIYTKTSAAAALYQTIREVDPRALQPAARTMGNSGLAFNAVTTPAERQAQVEAALQSAVARLEHEQGTDWAQWRWGRMHVRAFQHPLGVKAFDLPTVERPGGAGTVAADGASYREIFDTADWDRALVTNTPGQSGQPGSPFYGNLLPLWAENTYFPLPFSDAAVERHAAHRLTLQPTNAKQP